MTGLIVSALGFTLIGAAVSRLAGGPRFLLGLGSVGLVLHLTMLLGIDPRFALLAMIAAAVVVLMLRRGRADAAREQVTHSRAAVAVMMLPVAAALFISAVIPLRDYDGRAFWMLKARAIATEKAIDGPFFREEVVHSPRNQYPLLIPLDAAAAMIAGGEADDRHARWIYILALASFALYARRFIGDWVAALIPWIPQFGVWPDGGMLSAYNDLIVAAFAGCAVFDLVERRAPLRFGLWLSFLVLTKNEGLPLALVLLVAGVIVFRKQVLVSMAPLAAGVVLLFVWRGRITATDEQPFFELLPTLPSQLHRLVPVVVRFAGHAFDFDQWGLFWVAAALSVVVLAWRKEWKPLLVPAFVIVATAAAYIAAYLVTSWRVEDLVDASANRLLMHLAMPALYIIGASARSR